MAQVFTILRENKMIEELIKALEDNKANIKDLVCIVRDTSGDINVVNSGAGFETLCSGAKMIDYMISEVLDEDNAIYEEIEEENE